MIIASLLVLFIVMYISYKLNIGLGGGLIIFLLAFFGIVFGGIMLVAKIENKKENKMKEKLLDSNVPEKEKEEIRQYFKDKRLKELEKEKNIAILDSVKYIGGHEEYTKESKVNIILREDELVFTSWLNYDNVCFRIPTNQIEDIKYGKSEDITFGRYLLFGLASMAFKKTDVLFAN